MGVIDFEEKFRQELKNLNITLLDIYTRRRVLCVDWSFEEGRKFSSCFRIEDSHLQNNPDDIIYAMIRNILYGLSHPDNVVGEISKIESPRRKK